MIVAPCSAGKQRHRAIVAKQRRHLGPDTDQAAEPARCMRRIVERIAAGARLDGFAIGGAGKTVGAQSDERSQRA